MSSPPHIAVLTASIPIGCASAIRHLLPYAKDAGTNGIAYTPTAGSASQTSRVRSGAGGCAVVVIVVFLREGRGQGFGIRPVSLAIRALAGFLTEHPGGALSPPVALLIALAGPVLRSHA